MAATKSPQKTDKKKSDQKTSGKKKSGKKQDALVADLNQQVKKLTKRLSSVEAERDQLARQVTKQKAKAKNAVAQAEKQAKKAIAKIRATVDQSSTRAVTFIEDHSPLDAPAPKAPATKAVPRARASSSTGPDTSWTVTQLRAEARKQNVTGYSRLTKAQLLAALN